MLPSGGVVVERTVVLTGGLSPSAPLGDQALALSRCGLMLVGLRASDAVDEGGDGVPQREIIGIDRACGIVGRQAGAVPREYDERRGQRAVA